MRLPLHRASARSASAGPARFSPSPRATPPAMPASCTCAIGPRGPPAPARGARRQRHLFDTGGTNLKPFKACSTCTRTCRAAPSRSARCSRSRGSTRRVASMPGSRSPRTAPRRAPTSRRTSCTPRNGTSIQVIHTDAEGRMALADTLALAGRTRPQLIIDYATLTGACVNALTERYSGVFTNRAARERSAHRGRRRERRARVAVSDGRRLRRGAEERHRRRQAMRHRERGRSHPRRAFPESLRAAPRSLDTRRSQRRPHKGGLAHVPTDITGFGVRFTLELLAPRLRSLGARREAAA